MAKILISKASPEGTPLEIADIVDGGVIHAHPIETAKIPSVARALSKPKGIKYLSGEIDQIQSKFPGTTLEEAVLTAEYVLIRQEPIPTAKK